MKYIDHKLTFSWSDKGICTITDNATNKSMRIDMESNFCSGDLEVAGIEEDVDYLINTLNTGNVNRQMFMKNPTAYKSDIIIRDTGHYMWDIIEHGHYATVKEQIVNAAINFDKDLVLKRLYMTNSVISMQRMRINPKVDIVRRIADCGLLVWNYNGKYIVVDENHVNGISMENALICGEHHRALMVDSSTEKKTCTVIDMDTGEIVFECPLDYSISTYYTPAEELMGKE